MGVVLSEKTAQRVREVISRVPGSSGAPGGSPSARQVAFVRVTGAVDGDGFYPCVVTAYLTEDDTWEDAEESAIVFEPNAADLTSGQRYLAARAGDTEDGEAVFLAVPIGVTMRGKSTAAPYADHVVRNVIELIFSNGVGVGGDDILNYGSVFRLSPLNSHTQARLSIRAAESGFPGILTADSQTISGIKTFEDGIILEAGELDGGTW